MSTSQALKSLWALARVAQLVGASCTVQQEVIGTVRAHT